MLVTLIFYSNIPSAIFCDSMLVGECSPSRGVAFPLQSGSELIVRSFPLADCFAAWSASVRAEADRLIVSRFARVVQWQNGVYELYIPNERCLYEKNVRPGAIARHAFDDGSISTLYVSDAGGIHIVIERGDEPLYSGFVAFEGDARMEYRRFEGGEALLVYCGDGCCVIKKRESGCELIFAGHGEFSLEESALICTERLSSLAGYTRRTKVDIVTGKITQLAAESARPYRAQTEKQAARALLEALLYGAEQDLPRLLTGELKKLSPAQLRAYFGQFSDILEAPMNPAGVVYGLSRGGQLDVPAIFSFECEETGGAIAVSNAIVIRAAL